MSSFSQWIRQSPPDDFWFFAAVLIALTVAGFIGAFHFFHRKRIMEDTPTSKIRSAAQGYVELSGHGELMEGEPIIAPLTGTRCTWYSYKIEERRRSGKKHRWVTIDEGTSDGLFLLIDETGQCIIDPEDASVTPSVSDTWYGRSARPSRGPRGKSSGFFSLGSGRYRYSEKRMHPKDILYAIGLYKTVGGAGGELNPDADVRDLLREWKKDSEALLRKFDSNEDGQIDMEEWQAVREQALRQVMAMHRERKTAPPINMMTKTCDRRRPYLLSALPHDALIRRFYYYSIGLMVLFFVCGTVVTWMINLRLSVV